MLINCAGSLGSTGTFTVIILIMYGYTFEEVLNIVQEEGSNPGNRLHRTILFSHKG